MHSELPPCRRETPELARLEELSDERAVSQSEEVPPSKNSPNLPPWIGGTKFFHLPSILPTRYRSICRFVSSEWRLYQKPPSASLPSSQDQKSVEKGKYSRSHLNGSVSTDHMQNRLLPPRVVGDPHVRLDDELVEDKNLAALRDQGSHFLPREEGAFFFVLMSHY